MQIFCSFKNIFHAEKGMIKINGNEFHKVNGRCCIKGYQCLKTEAFLLDLAGWKPLAGLDRNLRDRGQMQQIKQ